MPRRGSSAGPRPAHPSTSPHRSDFGLWIRDALVHLHDLPYLQTHPLTKFLPRPADASTASAGESLQHYLSSLIHRLGAAPAALVSPKVWRRSRLMALRYLDGLDVAAACEQLVMSKSEYYREHGQSLDAIVSFFLADVTPIPGVSALDTGAVLPSGASAARFPLDLLPLRTQLVGRSRELGYLLSQFEAVVAGGPGRLIFLSGDAGVGKTRLAEELGAYVRRRGGNFLAGRNVPDGSARYIPWMESLRAGLQGIEPVELARMVGPYAVELSRVLPELMEQADILRPATTLPPEEQRYRLGEGITRLLAHLSQRAPLLLFLDDLQWAPGLSVLTQVARHAAPLRILILAAYREQEFRERPDLMHVWADLNKSRLATHIPLAPFSEEETAKMIAQYLGEQPADVLAPPVFRSTRGNAFFVEEVLRSLVESGAVRWVATDWEVVDATAIRIPDSVILAFMERLERLGTEVQEVLTQAAVLGQEFSFPLLTALTGLPEQRLVTLIERAIAARVLIDRSVAVEERYAFQDDQMQEVLYDSIAGPRRRRWHHLAAAALESLHPDGDETYLEEIAHHYTNSNDPERGAEYAYRAGVKADRALSWSQAIRWYRKALALWEDLGGHIEQRARANERLGDTNFKSGIDPVGGLEAYQRAVALNAQLGRHKKVAELHAEIGREYGASESFAIRDAGQALEQLNVALSIIGDDAEGPTLGRVQSGLARSHSYYLRMEETRTWAERALAAGEQLHDRALIANASVPLGETLVGMGSIGPGLAHLERAWSLASERGWAYQAEHSRVRRLAMAVLLKDTTGGLDWAEKQPVFQTLSRTVRAPHAIAALHALRGDFTTARRVLTDLPARLESLGQPHFGHMPAEIGMVLLRRGDWAEAQRVLEDGLQWARGRQFLRTAAPAAAMLGELFLEMGELDRAREHLSWALETYRTGGAIMYELRLLPQICALAARTGELDLGFQHLATAQRIAHTIGDIGALQGELALAEGLVQAAHGRYEQAESAFRLAVAVYHGRQLRWDEAKAYFEWGCALLCAGPDAAQAHMRGRQHLEHARDLWEAMDIQRYVEQCNRKLNNSYHE